MTCAICFFSHIVTGDTRIGNRFSLEYYIAAVVFVIPADVMFSSPFWGSGKVRRSEQKACRIICNSRLIFGAEERGFSSQSTPIFAVNSVNTVSNTQGDADPLKKKTFLVLVVCNCVPPLVYIITFWVHPIVVGYLYYQYRETSGTSSSKAG